MQEWFCSDAKVKWFKLIDCMEAINVFLSFSPWCNARTEILRQMKKYLTRVILMFFILDEWMTSTGNLSFGVLRANKALFALNPETF